MMIMGNNFKKNIMAYIYNNKKLERIIQIQQRKKKMFQGVDDLKKEVAHWQRAQASLLRGTFDQTYETRESMNNNTKTPLLQGTGAAKIDDNERQA
jgi:CRISPR/Cas system CMR subunit Cmr6 (Cas7 group RAMP superfamily)